MRLVLNLKDTGARTRERPVSRFVAASGPGAPIELRSADFMGRRTSTVDHDPPQTGTSSYGRPSHDPFPGSKDDEEDTDVLDLKPLRHGSRTVDRVGRQEERVSPRQFDAP